MARSRLKQTVTLPQDLIDYLRQKDVNASGAVEVALRNNVPDHYVEDAHRRAARERAAVGDDPRYLLDDGRLSDDLDDDLDLTDLYDDTNGDN